jgi:AcrR family transcriptional regulator
LRPIARAVGLTAPALYRYFPSRAHLLRDLPFREWSLAHPRELALVFATPIGSIDPDGDERLKQAGDRFGGVFLGLMLRQLAERLELRDLHDPDGSSR